jgi:hypothetical protein
VAGHASDDPSQSPDPGLRRLLTWTFLALAFALLVAWIGVSLAIRFFDTP